MHRKIFARQYSRPGSISWCTKWYKVSLHRLDQLQQNRISIFVLKKQIEKKFEKIFFLEFPLGFLKDFEPFLDRCRFSSKMKKKRKKIEKNGPLKMPLESVLRNIITWMFFYWLSPSFGVSKKWVFSFIACI